MDGQINNHPTPFFYGGGSAKCSGKEKDETQLK